MTVSDRRKDISANGGDSHQTLPAWLRIVGRLVILATAIAVSIPALWVLTPNLLTDSWRVEDLTIRVLIASLAVSSVGGLFMSAMTKNPWWLLTPIAAGAVVAFWLLIGAAMGPLMH